MTAKSVRIDGDVVAAAASVAARSHRSVAEQINYWVAVGRRVTAATGVEQRRLDRAVAGEEQFSALTPEERVIAHARVDCDIQERALSTAFGELARADGVTTVTMNDDGDLIKTMPDGATSRL